MDIAANLHIGPRMQDEFTVDEFEQACYAIDQIRAEAAKNGG